MRTYLTAAPNAEPPATAALPPRCPRRPDLRAPRRVPHDAVSPRHRHATAAVTGRLDPNPAQLCAEAHRFAETALRLTLEVLDRRRQPPRLRAMLAPAPFDLVVALSRRDLPGRRLGVARVRRIHVCPAGAGSAELFGSYTRGDRTFAIAGRLENTAAAPGTGGTGARGGWMFTSLQIG
ncbi:Rv3235 family protein [Rhodococcus sp. NPDC003318]|uniref:Rv3235 family protein n=1 Tax=Rhodococcus sp. NPDC003318 TaxID=3364503 RepID=UPI003698777D